MAGYYPRANMTRIETAYFISMLSDSDIVFEWGSGQSTILFSQWCRRFYSVDDSAEWYQRVKQFLVTDNVVQFLQEDHKKYANEIHFSEGLYDFIFIDGAERVACALEARKHLKETGFLIVHDWNRPEYGEIRKAYREIKVVDTLGILILK